MKKKKKKKDTCSTGLLGRSGPSGLAIRPWWAYKPKDLSAGCTDLVLRASASSASLIRPSFPGETRNIQLVV